HSEVNKLLWFTALSYIRHSLSRLRTSHHRLRQRHLDALDSGEELSYPVHGIDHPRRQYRLEANHLGKSTGTGLDVLAIAELARSVTTLRSDIERLTAQQQSLLAASRTDLHENRVRSTSQLDSAHSSSRLHLATTPTGSTRAMWSTRTPLRYPSQCDVQEQCTSPQEGCSVPVEPTNPIEAPQQNAPSPPIEKHSVNASLLESEPKEPQDDSVTKSLSSEPEVIKPAEKLFITFENPTSERLQRARERLEARRAADRSKLTESVIRARIADREAQFFEEVSQMSRKVQHLPPDSVPSTDPESDNSGFPVHTTIDGDTGRIAGAGAGNSATLPKSSRPNSARPRCPKTSTTLQQQNASTGQRLSRSSSLSRPNIRSSVTSSNGNRSIASASVTGGVNSTHGKRDAVSMNRQRSASRQSIGRLSNGPSLSSLHRSENGEESTHSGPGLPIAGIQPQTRLYVKPKSKSNRQVIVNAISHYCLAGAVNEPAKKAALQELASVDGSHFIVLFRDGRCQYRALYAFDFDTEELKLICGNGPRKITHSMCDKFYKYNSGAKQFSEITSTKHLSAVVDAITIQNSWWMRGPPLYSNAARIAAASVSAAHDDSRS
uniref:CKK domain-containing protein n=1 Tax=Mesocestoides corti TaxID=53468 RepID=A0A5K3EVK9_MESCO